MERLLGASGNSCPLFTAWYKWNCTCSVSHYYRMFPLNKHKNWSLCASLTSLKSLPKCYARAWSKTGRPQGKLTSFSIFISFISCWWSFSFLISSTAFKLSSSCSRYIICGFFWKISTKFPYYPKFPEQSISLFRQSKKIKIVITAVISFSKWNQVRQVWTRKRSSTAF